MPKKDEDELVLDLDPQQILLPHPNTHAVYRSPEEKGVHAFPLLLWGSFEVVERQGNKTIEDGQMIHGLVSQLGGLVIAEEVEDLVFVGYWRDDLQKLEEFLADHQSLAKSGNPDDVPEEDEHDEEDDEEDEGD